MKIVISILAIISYSFFIGQNNVGVGTLTPNQNAVLDIESDNKGVLIPRLSTVAKDALGLNLGAVDNGMLVYDRDLLVFYYWDGTQWILVGSGMGSDDQQLTGNLTGTNLQIDLEDGGSVIVDLVALQDGVNDADSDPTNELELPTSALTSQVLTWDGTAWVAQSPGAGADNWGNEVVNISGTNIAGNGTTTSPITITEVDGSITNEIQDLSLNTATNILTITNNGSATSINLTAYLDNTDAQTLSLSGNVLSISNGNNVTLIDNSGTDDQNITGSSYSASTGNLIIGIENGNSQTVDLSTLLPSGAVIAFNLNTCPTGWAPADGTSGMPDLRGEFVRGLDNGRGVDASRVLASAQADGIGAHSHNVDPPSTNTSSAGNHSHSIDPPSTNTSSAGSHSHSVDPPSTNTNSAGNHRHAWTYIEGNNDSGDQTGWFDSSPNSDNQGTKTTYTNYAGAHTHSVNIAAFSSASAGAHTHSVNIGAFNSASTGAHTHSVDISAFNTANTGGGETKPRNVALLYCVKQ